MIIVVLRLIVDGQLDNLLAIGQIADDKVGAEHFVRVEIAEVQDGHVDGDHLPDVHPAVPRLVECDGPRLLLLPIQAQLASPERTMPQE